MAQSMKVSLAYATHLPALIQVMSKTTGDVLELGTGVFSTPYLRYQCMLANRLLVSYENYKEWYDFMLKYWKPNANHEINFVEKYEDAQIDKEWDVVLVDQTPDLSRKETVKILADKAQYIVIHDSNDNRRGRRIYQYDEIYPLFKYKKLWDKDDNHATVLSNFHSLEDLW